MANQAIWGGQDDPRPAWPRLTGLSRPPWLAAALALVAAAGLIFAGLGISSQLMPRQFNDAELAQQKRVRAAFDPEARLNPAKVFPLGERAA